MDRTESVKQKIESFVQTMITNRKIGKGHLGNVYYLFTEDRDGNITSEAFGNNVLTNQGFRMMFDNANIFINPQQYMSLVLGKGTEPAKLTDTNLGERFTEVSDDIYTAPPTINLPWKYDSEADHLYRPYPIYGAYFDYEGFDNAKYTNGRCEVEESEGGNQFTEFGLFQTLRGGYNANYQQYICRSLVYDENGNTTYIQKNKYERLYVYCYYIASVALQWHRDLIEKGYITTFNPETYKTPGTNDNMTIYHRIVDYDAWRRNHAYYSYGTNHSNGWYNTSFNIAYYSGKNSVSTYLKDTTDGNDAWKHRVLNVGTNPDVSEDEDCLYHKDAQIDTTIKIEAKNWHADRFVVTSIPGGGNGSNLSYKRVGGFFIEYPMKLPKEETLVIDDLYTDPRTLQYNMCFGYSYGDEDYRNTHNFSSKYPYFDMLGIAPITDCDIEKIEFYNYKNDSYDIQANFENGKQDYLIEECWDTCSEYFCDYNGGTTVYVWCNPRKKTGHKIIRFDKIDNNMMMFATEEWWDPTKWKRIPNFNSLPEGDEYQDAQYYITTSQSAYMNQWSGLRITMFPIREGYTKPALTNITPLTELFKFTSDNHPIGTATYRYLYSYIPSRLPALSDNDKGWVLIDNTLLYPDKVDPSTGKQYMHTIHSHRWDSTTKTFIKNDTKNSYIPENGTFGNSRYLMQDGNICIFNNWTAYYSYDTALMGLFFTIIKPSSDPANEPEYENVWLFPTLLNPDELTNEDASFYINRGWKWDKAYVSVSKDRYIAYYNKHAETKAYQKASLIDITKINNAEPGTSYACELENIAFAVVIHNTKYCVVKFTNDDALKLVIYDIEAQKQYKEFTLDTDTYSSVNYAFGWNKYIYIKATTILGYSVYTMYNYETGEFTSMGDNSTIDLEEKDLWNYEPPYAKDDYMIWIGQTNYRPMLVHNNDPTNFKYLDPNKHIVSDFRVRSPQFKETENGKHLLMAFSFNSDGMNNYTYVMDLGYAINHNEFPNTPIYYYTSQDRGEAYGNTIIPLLPSKAIRYYTGSKSYYFTFAGIYKDDVIFYQSVNSAEALNDYNMTVYRISCYEFLGARMTLKTRSVQCYNNTRKFTFNQSFKWQWTNKTERKKLVDLKLD